MFYAAKPSREISDSLWSKRKTIMIHEFLDPDERNSFVSNNEEWIPVLEGLPEVKKLAKETEANPNITLLPRPIRMFIETQSKDYTSVGAYLKNYQDNRLEYK